MAEPNSSKSNDALHKLIAGGAELAGGAVGGALGFLAGGHLGAAVLGVGGAAAAMALKQIGTEAAERLLGPREKTRIGAALAIAAAEIQKRIGEGQTLRGDQFFEAKPGGGRSDAEEVAENVLLKAQREAEEKKVRYLGFLLANVAFDASISPAMAHQIIKMAEQLTYRQLCLLKLAVVKGGLALRSGNYRGQGQFAKPLYQILYECLDLSHRGLVNFGSEVVFGPTDVEPGKMTIQGLGGDIFNLMRLALIPDKDLQPIAAQLK